VKTHHTQTLAGPLLDPTADRFTAFVAQMACMITLPYDLG